MYIITARRITSGELLKYRKGFYIDGSYGSYPGASMPICSDNAHRMVGGRV